MVVEGKVVGRDDVDTGILLDLPVGKSQPLTLGEKVGLGDLASPVRLVGLLQVTENTDTAFKVSVATCVSMCHDELDLREPEDGRFHHDERWGRG